MKPILFNTEMVRAILKGRKSVTRRVVKPQPKGDGSKPEPLITRQEYWNAWGDDNVYRQPFQKGDILWVRETWSISDGLYLYRAFPGIGSEPEKQDAAMRKMGLKWRPSIHMPRNAARIFLKVIDVRVERLQAISHEDAEQEGCWCDEGGLSMPIDNFAELWDSTIKPKHRTAYGWGANPWVWVIEFERISKEEAEK